MRRYAVGHLVLEDGVSGDVGEDRALCLMAIRRLGSAAGLTRAATAARFSSRSLLFSFFSLGCCFELRPESS